MSAQYLVSERTFHVHMLVENLCIVVEKYVFDSSSGSALFLIFHQNPGSCPYKQGVYIDRAKVNQDAFHSISLHFIPHSTIILYSRY